MTWKLEHGSDGLPVWRGRDSIVNVNREQSWQTYGCAIPCIAVILIIGTVFLFNASEDRGAVAMLGKFLGTIFLLFGGGIGLLIAVMMSKGSFSAKAFFDEPWTLWEVKNSKFHGLAFLRNESGNRPVEEWSAPLSDIARIEIGPTQQWTASRTFGALVHEVSPHETQAFLFMNDSSRRVICSVNANSEATSTLAHSVRSWFEKAKAEAMTARLDAPPEDERRPGFDI